MKDARSFRPGAETPAAKSGTRLALPGPIGLLAALLFLFALVQGIRLDDRAANIDYYQYWVVGRALRAGEAGDVYSHADRVRLAGEAWQEARDEAAILKRDTARLRAAEFRRAELGTYSTPWLYTFAAATAGADYARAQGRFQLAGLTALTLGALVLCALLGHPPAAGLLAAAFLILAFDPVRSDVGVGNVNRIQLGLLVLYLATRRLRPSLLCDALSGFVLAQLVLFKPNLGLVVLALAGGWVATGARRVLLGHALGAGVGALAAVGVSSLVFGSPAAWASWAAEVGPLLGEFDHSLGRGNVSLVRVAAEATGFGSSTVFATAVLLPVAVLLGRARRSRRGDPAGPRDRSGGGSFELEALLCSLGALLALLAADLAWLHYYVLAIPLGLFLVRPAGARRDGRVPAAYTPARLCGVLGLLLIAREPLAPALGALPELGQALALVLGALLLYTGGLIELARLSGCAEETGPVGGDRDADPP